MKEGWEYKKIGEIMQVERGGSPRPIEKYITNDSNGYNWIKISDATASTKYIFETKQKITKEGLHKTRVVNDGDFILSNSMSFGRPYIMKTSGCIHDGWLVLRDKHQVQLSKDFLYYLLSSPYIFQQFDILAAGSTVRNLNIGLVSSVKIPLPPLPEQHRIVSILDETFAAIAKAKENTEKNLKNVREVFESYLQNIYINMRKEWKMKKLGDIFTFKNGINFDKTQKTGKGILTIDVLNMYFEGLKVNIENLYRVEKQISEEYKLKTGDILIVRSSVKEEGVAWTAFFEEANEPITFCGFIIRGRPTEVINTEYVVYYLRCKDVRNELIKKAVKSTITNINQATLSEILIPLPTLPEQLSVVTKLKHLAAETIRLETIYKQKITVFEELKKSILQKAFTGELNTI